METKEIVNSLPYHEVDLRWPVLSRKDYATYLERYLVEANFHEGVPESVKESFKIVEFIIAHSWYHYPMYDEALNRTLRTFEFAIKKKCNLLSIPLEELNKKKNIHESRRLAHLIKDICAQEPSKRQSIFLKHLKDLRNSLMHPLDHHFSGGISFGAILLSVNIINILFAPEKLMVSLDQLTALKQKEISLLAGKPMAFLTGEKAILIHCIHFGDALKNEKGDIVLLYAEPVCKFTEEQKAKQAFPQQIPVEILNPVITKERITGTDLNTGLDIIITLVTEKRDLQVVKAFQEYLHNITVGPHNFSPYLTNRMNEIANGLQKFRYKYYQTMKVNS